MKTLLTYSLLLAVLFGNSGAGCSSKNSDDPQPGNDIKLLVGGLWEVTQTLTVTPSDKITLKLKKGALGFKFYTDGKLESCSSGTCSPIGRWSFLLQSQSAGTGTLTMYIENSDIASVYGNKMEGYLDISTDNFVRWVITGNPTIGKTDATEIQWAMERNP